MIASLYGQRATLFDNMPFENATYNIHSNAMGWSIDINPWLTNATYGKELPWAPKIGQNISGYAVSGEMLAFLRGVGGSSFQPQTIDTGSFIYPVGGLSPLDRHSQALLTVLLFGEQEVSSQVWLNARPYFVGMLQDKEIALAAGAESIPGRYNDDNDYGSILATALAYSAIDEGTMPFGNTGIRALFDDATDLGNGLQVQDISLSIQSFAKAISQVFVQFAGQLAIRKVVQGDATKGVLTLSEDQKILVIDFADELWKVGGTVPSEILGRKEIVDAAIIDAGLLPPGIAPNDIHSGLKWLWGSDSSDIIDRVELATTNGELTTTLQNRTTTSDKVSLFVAGGSNDDITGSRDDNMIFGGEGNDTLRGGAGDDLLAGGIGDDRLSGGEGRNFLDGGRGKDTTFYEHDQGVRMTMTKVEDSTVGQPIFELDLGHGTVDRITGIEKIELTDRPDYLRVDQSALGADITIDMGKSDWDQDFIKNRDTVDYSDFDTGLTYWNGSVGTGFKSYFLISDDLVIKGAEKIILTAHNDWVVNADPGTIIETGDGNDVIWAMGNNVAISDLSYTDRIKLGGILPLLGGVRNIHSNSIYAAAWSGLFQYAVNHLGELKISSPIFGDMWVLNYGDSAPYGEKAGHIYLYQFEMEVLRLVDMKRPVRGYLDCGDDL